MQRLSTQLYDAPGGKLLLDMTGRIEGARFATNERGFLDWSGFVPMSSDEAFGWYDFTIGHLVVSDGAAVVYSGRIEDPSPNGDASQGPVGLELKAFGYQRAMYDIPYTALWSTQLTSEWEAVTQAQVSSRAPERFAMNTDGELRITPNSGQAFDSTHLGSLTFVIPHLSSKQIQRVTFSYDVKVPNATWTASLSRFTDAYGFQSVIWTMSATGSGTQDITLTACDRLVLNLQFNRARTALGTLTNNVSTTLGTASMDVNTTLGTAIAAGVRVVTPGSMAGIVTGRNLIIGGATEETVTVSATTATTFTATFVAAHNAADMVRLGTNAVTVTPPSMAGIVVGSTLDIGGTLPEIVTVTAITSTTFTANFVNAHSAADTVRRAGIMTWTPGSMTGIVIGSRLLIGNEGGATRSQAEEVEVLTVTATSFTAEFKFPHSATDTISFIHTGEEDTCYVKLTNMRVLTTTNNIVYVGDIAADILTTIDTLNPAQIDSYSGLLGISGLDLKEAWFEDEYPGDILTALVARGDSAANRWEWKVWDGQRLRVQPERTGGQTWYVDEAPRLVRSLDGIINSSYATYKDVSGRTKRTAVSSSAASVSSFSLTRRAAINADTTSATDAATIRDTFIADNKYNGSLGEFEVKRLRTADGAIVPGWMCRAGDTIIVRGYPAGSALSIDYIRSFPVLATEYSYSSSWRDLGRLRITSTRKAANLALLLARKD